MPLVIAPLNKEFRIIKILLEQKVKKTFRKIKRESSVILFPR